METTNKPLTHKEIKELSKGVHETSGPNRQERRMVKQAMPGNNRKATKGRQKQVTDIVAPEMKFGEKILVPTGFVRRVIHRVVEAKKDKVRSKVLTKVYEARNPVTDSDTAN